MTLKNGSSVVPMLAAASIFAGCSGGNDAGGPDSTDHVDSAPACGPASAEVKRVIDGDTVELADGTRVRYLLIDTPEITNGHDECGGAQARDLNRQLVEGKEVHLAYDVECKDMFGRLLAWVEVQGVDVNRLLVEQGFACVLYVPPNGKDRLDEFRTLEALAKSQGAGMWGACPEVACD